MAYTTPDDGWEDVGQDPTTPVPTVPDDGWVDVGAGGSPVVPTVELAKPQPTESGAGDGWVDVADSTPASDPFGTGSPQMGAPEAQAPGEAPEAPEQRPPSVAEQAGQAFGAAGQRLGQAWQDVTQGRPLEAGGDVLGAVGQGVGGALAATGIPFDIGRRVQGTVAELAGQNTAPQQGQVVAPWDRAPVSPLDTGAQLIGLARAGANIGQTVATQGPQAAGEQIGRAWDQSENYNYMKAAGFPLNLTGTVPGFVPVIGGAEVTIPFGRAYEYGLEQAGNPLNYIGTPGWSNLTGRAAAGDVLANRLATMSPGPIRQAAEKVIANGGTLAEAARAAEQAARVPFIGPLAAGVEYALAGGPAGAVTKLAGGPKIGGASLGLGLIGGGISMMTDKEGRPAYNVPILSPVNQWVLDRTPDDWKGAAGMALPFVDAALFAGAWRLGGMGVTGAGKVGIIPKAVGYDAANGVFTKVIRTLGTPTRDAAIEAAHQRVNNALLTFKDAAGGDEFAANAGLAHVFDELQTNPKATPQSLADAFNRVQPREPGQAMVPGSTAASAELFNPDNLGALKLVKRALDEKLGMDRRLNPEATYHDIMNAVTIQNGGDMSAWAKALETQARDLAWKETGYKNPDWNDPARRLVAAVRQLAPDQTARDIIVNNAGPEWRLLHDYLEPTGARYRLLRDFISGNMDEQAARTIAPEAAKIARLAEQAVARAKAKGMLGVGDAPPAPIALDPAFRGANVNPIFGMAQGSKQMISPYWLLFRPAFHINNMMGDGLAIARVLGTAGMRFLGLADRDTVHTNLMGNAARPDYIGMVGQDFMVDQTSWIPRKQSVVGQAYEGFTKGTPVIGPAVRKFGEAAGAPGRAIERGYQSLQDKLPSVITERGRRDIAYVAALYEKYPDAVKTVGADILSRNGIRLSPEDIRVALDQTTRKIQAGGLESFRPNRQPVWFENPAVPFGNDHVGAALLRLAKDAKTPQEFATIAAEWRIRLTQELVAAHQSRAVQAAQALVSQAPPQQQPPPDGGIAPDLGGTPPAMPGIRRETRPSRVFTPEKPAEPIIIRQAGEPAVVPQKYIDIAAKPVEPKVYTPQERQRLTNDVTRLRQDQNRVRSDYAEVTSLFRDVFAEVTPEQRARDAANRRTLNWNDPEFRAPEYNTITALQRASGIEPSVERVAPYAGIQTPDNLAELSKAVRPGGVPDAELGRHEAFIRSYSAWLKEMDVLPLPKVKAPDGTLVREFATVPKESGIRAKALEALGNGDKEGYLALLGREQPTAEQLAVPAERAATVLYHGTSATDVAPYVDAQGNLILRPSENFGGKQVGVSLAPDVNTAWDYAGRSQGLGPNRGRTGTVFEIDRSALPQNRLRVEAADEVMVRGNGDVVIPAGKWRQITDENARAGLAAWERRTASDISKLSDEDLVRQYHEGLLAKESSEQARAGEDYTANAANQLTADIWQKHGQAYPELGFIQREVARRLAEGNRNLEAVAANISSPVFNMAQEIADLRPAPAATEAPRPPVAAPPAAVPTAREPWQMTRKEYFHPQIERAALERFQQAKQGETVGTIRDFIHGALTRDALKDVLDVPVVRLDRPIQKGKAVAVPEGVEFKGASGTLAGKNAVFIRHTPDWISTLFEEAAHQERIARGRPMTKQDITAINWSAYERLPEELTAKKFADYLKALVSKELDHEQIVAQALREGKPVPPEVLAEYPDLAKGAQGAPTARPGDTPPTGLTPASQEAWGRVRAALNQPTNPDGSAYIVPQMRVSVAGKEQLVNAADLIRMMPDVEDAGMNRYRLRPPQGGAIQPAAMTPEQLGQAIPGFDQSRIGVPEGVPAPGQTFLTQRLEQREPIDLDAIIRAAGIPEHRLRPQGNPTPRDVLEQANLAIAPFNADLARAQGLKQDALAAIPAEMRNDPALLGRAVNDARNGRTTSPAIRAYVNALDAENAAMRTLDTERGRIMEQLKAKGYEPGITAPEKQAIDRAVLGYALDDPMRAYGDYLGQRIDRIVQAGATPIPAGIDIPYEVARQIQVAASDLARRQAVESAQAALLNYTSRSYGQYILDHITPYSFWTMQNMGAWGQWIARHPGQYAAIMAAAKDWQDQTQELSPGMRWTVHVMKLADGTEIRFRPGTINPYAGGNMFEVLSQADTNSRTQTWFQQLQDLTGTSFHFPIGMGLNAANTRMGWNDTGPGATAVRTMSGYGTGADRGQDLLAQNALARKLTGGRVDLEAGYFYGIRFPSLREAIYGTNALGIDDYYTVIELTKRVANGQLTELQAKQAILSAKQGQANDAWNEARGTALWQQGQAQGVRYMGLPVSALPPERQRIDALNKQYNDMKNSGALKQELTAFMRNNPGLETKWAGNDDPRLLAVQVATSAYYDIKNQLDAKYAQQFKDLSDQATSGQITPAVWFKKRSEINTNKRYELDQLSKANPDADITGSKARDIKAQIEAEAKARGEQLPAQTQTAADQKAAEAAARAIVDNYFTLQEQFKQPDGSFDSKGWAKARDQYVNSLSEEDKKVLNDTIKKNQTEMDVKFENTSRYLPSITPQGAEYLDKVKSIYEAARYAPNGNPAAGRAALVKAGLPATAYEQMYLPARNPEYQAYFLKEGQSATNIAGNRGNGVGGNTYGRSGVVVDRPSIDALWNQYNALKDQNPRQARQFYADNFDKLYAGAKNVPTDRPDPKLVRLENERSAIYDRYPKDAATNKAAVSQFYTAYGKRLDEINAALGKPTTYSQPLAPRTTTPYVPRSGGGGSIRPGPRPGGGAAPRPIAPAPSEWTRFANDAGSTMVQALDSYWAGRGPLPSPSLLAALRKRYPFGVPDTATMQAWLDAVRVRRQGWMQAA